MPFILIGFAAQMIDGALGMAFGQISSTLLITLGVPPAAASAGVHTAETFTTAVSGISHVAHRNVDWRLFFRIVIPGVLSGVTRRLSSDSEISAEAAKPVVLTYLTALGAYLFYRGVMHRHTERQPKVVAPLGSVGGFLDAAGGGGWGAIVTSNLLVQGSNPRKTIGTVNTAEFFLTVTISATFIATLGLGRVHRRHDGTVDWRRRRRAVRRVDRQESQSRPAAELRRRALDPHQRLRDVYRVTVEVIGPDRPLSNEI